MPSPSTTPPPLFLRLLDGTSSSPITPRHRRQYFPRTFLWHLPPRQSSEAAPANSVPVPENENQRQVKVVCDGEEDVEGEEGGVPAPASMAAGEMPDEMVS